MPLLDVCNQLEANPPKQNAGNCNARVIYTQQNECMVHATENTTKKAKCKIKTLPSGASTTRASTQSKLAGEPKTARHAQQVQVLQLASARRCNAEQPVKIESANTRSIAPSWKRTPRNITGVSGLQPHTSPRLHNYAIEWSAPLACGKHTWSILLQKQPGDVRLASDFRKRCVETTHSLS